MFILKFTGKLIIKYGVLLYFPHEFFFRIFLGSKSSVYVVLFVSVCIYFGLEYIYTLCRMRTIKIKKCCCALVVELFPMKNYANLSCNCLHENRTTVVEIDFFLSPQQLLHNKKLSCAIIKLLRHNRTMVFPLVVQLLCDCCTTVVRQLCD